MTTKFVQMSASQSGKDGKRQRRYLPAAERKQEILDAALIEFSDRGFVATTIERIASRAGLSKAGIYAHYKSKDEIFEDLLMTLLVQQETDESYLLPDADASLPAIVDAYVDRLFSRWGNRRTVGTFRLLIAESGRSPELVRRWHNKAVDVILLKEQAMVDECLRRGVMRPGVLTDNFTLAAAPFVQWMVLQALLDDAAPMSAEQMRTVYKLLLLELLEPR